MHRRLHNDIKQLPLPRLRVHRDVVPPLDPKDDLQHVRDRDIAPPILVRRMQRPRPRHPQHPPDRPRPRAHEPRHRVISISVISVSAGVISGGVGGVEEGRERGRAERVRVVRAEREERRPVLPGVLEREEGDARGRVGPRDAPEPCPVVHALCVTGPPA